MTRTRLIAVPALVAILLAVAGTAAAQNVPPGVSGANQYTETLPGPGGNDAAGGNSGGAPKSPAQTLGAKNARKLEALGPEGKAAAELATKSSPADASPERAGRSGGKQAGGKEGPSTGVGSSGSKGSSGIQQVLGQITGTGGSDSGGMDWLLPLLIVASVVVAVTYLFNRHRSARPSD